MPASSRSAINALSVRRIMGSQADDDLRASDSNAHDTRPPPREIEFFNRNFTVPGEQLLRGMSGLPAYLRRARDLEDRTARFWKDIEAAYGRLREEASSRYDFARRWTTLVQTMDLTTLEA